VTVNDKLSRVKVRADPPRLIDYANSRSFRALNAGVVIECDDPEVLSSIEGILAPLRSEGRPCESIRVDRDSSDRWHVAVGDREPVLAGSPLAAVLRAVSEVNNVAVASVPDRLALHAGAVGGASGVVVLPAASNSGKSTLTTALVSAGFGYLSDEVAAIGPGLRCRPFPKAIALDPGSFPLFPDLAPRAFTGLDLAVSTREWHVDPTSIGSLGRSGRVAAVVCPKWRPGAETRLCRVGPVDAMQLLLGEAFDFAEGGQTVFDILGKLVSEVPVYRLGYGRLDGAVETISQLLGGIKQS